MKARKRGPIIRKSELEYEEELVIENTDIKGFLKGIQGSSNSKPKNSAQKIKEIDYEEIDQAITIRNNLLELVQNFDSDVKSILKLSKSKSMRDKIKEETDAIIVEMKDLEQRLARELN